MKTSLPLFYQIEKIHLKACLIYYLSSFLKKEPLEHGTHYCHSYLIEKKNKLKMIFSSSELPRATESFDLKKGQNSVGRESKNCSLVRLFVCSEFLLSILYLACLKSRRSLDEFIWFTHKCACLQLTTVAVEVERERGREGERERVKSLSNKNQKERKQF